MRTRRTSESWWNRSKILVSGASPGGQCPGRRGGPRGRGGRSSCVSLLREAGLGYILCFASLYACPLERKTVPLFPHPPVPSLSTSESKPPPQPSPPTSPVRTPLEVRLFPQLQTYLPYRPHPPQLRKVTSPLQSPTKTKPKVVSTMTRTRSRAPSFSLCPQVSFSRERSF